MNKRGLLTAVLIASALSACAVGPDFQQPAMSARMPEHFVRAESSTGSGAPAEPAGDTEFWRSFNDPQLSALVERALATNNDLRVALAHYDSDNALLREAKFDRYPTVTASGEVGHQRVSQDQAFGFPRSADVYSLSANASWEFDLWGRVRRNIEAQRAETAAASSDLQALQISVAGEVANVYVHLRGAQERLRIARDNAGNQRETLRIVNARLDAGRDADFDTSRAQAQFEATASRVPALEAQIAVDEHRLAVLTGRTPGELIAALDTPGPLPARPSRIDPDTPGNLLRRRPDVAAAEQRLHAATARVGVATADLFPRLTLEGMIGSFAFGGMFNVGSETNLVALGIDWSFLDVGRVRARIAASNADASGLLAQYQQTVLLALEDTENALVRYSNTRREDEYLEHAATSSTRAAQLARTQFQAGTIGLYEVLDAQRVQLQAQDAFAEVRTRSAATAIALYKALAGGWPQHMPVQEE
ncbi:efflux transporter outer membrane subunit [Paraburkholderia solisilvae]|uniref:Outer membrane protein OprM n=1 Tax=Paraburkholderia solisilvae TaxID=624376 RepID=A0A6J5EHP1_9BURK|nr:efflux transporter outer membrane subunit [Paraburkholderia solisilvae]CAB3765247.1 Outer membrane protein OprM [Paraburkholderia solisilvae]